ncbi:unnamed protein product, partial [Prorocentrum cordatum]
MTSTSVSSTTRSSTTASSTTRSSTSATSSMTLTTTSGTSSTTGSSTSATSSTTVTTTRSSTSATSTSTRSSTSATSSTTMTSTSVSSTTRSSTTASSTTRSSTSATSSMTLTTTSGTSSTTGSSTSATSSTTVTTTRSSTSATSTSTRSSTSSTSSTTMTSTSVSSTTRSSTTASSTTGSSTSATSSMTLTATSGTSSTTGSSTSATSSSTVTSTRSSTSATSTSTRSSTSATSSTTVTSTSVSSTTRSSTTASSTTGSSTSDTSSTTVTTTATSSTEARPLAPVTVSGALSVSGIDYAVLVGNETLRAEFEQVVKQGVAQEAGNGVTADDVDVTLSAGSVVVEFTVRVPNSASTGAVATMLASSPLASTVVSLIKESEVAAVASTGDIGVIFTGVDGAPVTTTAAPPEAAYPDGISDSLIVVFVSFGVLIPVGGVTSAAVLAHRRGYRRGYDVAALEHKSEQAEGARATGAAGPRDGMGGKPQPIDSVYDGELRQPRVQLVPALHAANSTRAASEIVLEFGSSGGPPIRWRYRLEGGPHDPQPSSPLAGLADAGVSPGQHASGAAAGSAPRAGAAQAIEDEGAAEGESLCGQLRAATAQRG